MLRTIFALVRSSRMTLKACSTQRDAVIALVVAIAGIILPAISETRLANEAARVGELRTLNVELGSRFDAKDK